LKTELAQQEIRLRAEFEERERKKEALLRGEVDEEVKKLRKEFEQAKVNWEKVVLAKEKEVSDLKAQIRQREEEITDQYTRKEEEILKAKTELEKELKELKQKNEEELIRKEREIEMKEKTIDELKSEREQWKKREEGLRVEVEHLEHEYRALEEEVENIRRKNEEKLLARDKEMNDLKLELARREAELRVFREKETEEKEKIRSILETGLKKVEARLEVEEKRVVPEKKEKIIPEEVTVGVETERKEVPSEAKKEKKAGLEELLEKRKKFWETRKS